MMDLYLLDNRQLVVAKSSLQSRDICLVPCVTVLLAAFLSLLDKPMPLWLRLALSRGLSWDVEVASIQVNVQSCDIMHMTTHTSFKSNDIWITRSHI